MKTNIVYTLSGMKEPVVESVYARVDILDYVDKAFVRTSSIYFLGDGAEYTKSPNDVKLNNKKLSEAIGSQVLKELIHKDEIKGGDDWDDLDDDDFENLLNEEPQLNIAKATNESMRSQLPKTDIISELIFYSKDKAADVKQKIAMVSGIKPYKQYLWVPKYHQSVNGDEISLIAHYTTSIRDIEGYPIDSHPPMPERPESIVQDFVFNQTVIMYCISLDSIVQAKNALRFLATSDSELFELIYNNTIKRFYPVMTRPVFNQYLINEKEIENKFHGYSFNIADITKKYDKRAKLFPYLNKYPKVDIDSSALITASTIDIVLASLRMTLTLDTQRLFQTLNLTSMSDIAFIDYYRSDASLRPIRLRKLQQKDQFRRNASVTQTVPVPSKELLFNRCIVFSYLPQSEFLDLCVVVNENGSVWIKASPNQSFVFSKLAFIKFIAPIINKLIGMINACESSFLVNLQLPHLSTTGIGYQIISSSTNLTFKKSIAYSKMTNLVIDKLLDAGIIEISKQESIRAGKGSTVFRLQYGITNNATSGSEMISEIEIKNVNETAVVSLSNLDVKETNLYVDIIGRLILSAGDTIKLVSTNQSELGLVDPVLFRPRISSDGYSRICQKKFQPVVTTKDDKKAVEYFNFTFNKPEYYKCSSKDNPVLGFIQGKHEHGYCLPCCRKTPQANAEEARKTCISNEFEIEERQSSYKIDYPIHSIPNHKIMNRRIKLPDHLIQLFGGKQLVANGTIMASHGGIRDGIKPDVKSFLQTATMLAAVDNGQGVPLFKSFRELIMELIALIQTPAMQLKLMKHKLISSRFTSPTELTHALEDYFMKQTIMIDSESKLSAMELNDIIIYLCNCKGMNALLLFDDRQTDITILNLQDIDVSKPVVLIIKRLNVEWSSHHQNTRALYLPITSNGFKVTHRSELLIERTNLMQALTKIKNIAMGKKEIAFNKQFTINRVQNICKKSKQYSLLKEDIDQSYALIGIGRKVMIATVTSLDIVLTINSPDESPTASLDDMLTFITDYNLLILDDSPNLNKSYLDSYKQYLQVALKINNRKDRYHLIDTAALLLKITKLIVCDNMIIGAVVALVDQTRIVASELMFIKPLRADDSKVKKEIQSMCDKQLSLYKNINPKAILTSPTDQSFIDITKVIVYWDTNPLEINIKQTCKKDLEPQFNMGLYLNQIYKVLVIELMGQWKAERARDIEDYVVAFIKKNKSLPIPETRIDKMIEEIPFSHIDKTIFRASMNALFDKINSIDKSADQAINRIRESDVFDGYDLKHLHKWTKKEVATKVQSILKGCVVKSNAYPSFDKDIPISDQISAFYTSKKLMLHQSIYDDIIDFLISDLCNPFRKDYIVNMQLTMTALEDIRPHIGELIYVQPIAKI